MSSPPELAADASIDRTQIFAWAIALATGLEYFDSTLFSFYLNHMAAGVNAAPDELIWAVSSYAVCSVLGILQQSWWIDRIGYRYYLSASLFLFAIASIAAGLSDSSLELAVARGVQGYLLGPMMGVVRIILRVNFPEQHKAAATRIFMLLILFASAVAPLVGGHLVSAFTWRSLFVCTALIGFALSILLLIVVPHVGHKDPDARVDTHFWPYLVFALAQGALQIVVQQLRFEFLSSSPVLIVLLIGGLALLALFIWHQWHHPRPLIQLSAFRNKVFQTGIILYIGFYFLNNALGYLTSRFIEGSLNYPVENAGRLIGYCSLVSIFAALLHFRYSHLITRQKWLIVPGFIMAAVVGGWMANLPPNVSMMFLVPPLILRGIMLLFIAMPTASVTFQIFAEDDFHHGYRIKNIVRQLTYSFATALIIVIEQHRMALHYEQ